MKPTLVDLLQSKQFGLTQYEQRSITRSLPITDGSMHEFTMTQWHWDNWDYGVEKVYADPRRIVRSIMLIDKFPPKTPNGVKLMAFLDDALMTRYLAELTDREYRYIEKFVPEEYRR